MECFAAAKARDGEQSPRMDLLTELLPEPVVLKGAQREPHSAAVRKADKTVQSMPAAKRPVVWPVRLEAEPAAGCVEPVWATAAQAELEPEAACGSDG